MASNSYNLLPAITGVGMELPNLVGVHGELGHRGRHDLDIHSGHGGEGNHGYSLNLAVKAGRFALQQAELDAKQIRLLLVGSMTQPNDGAFAIQIANELGINNEKTFLYEYGDYGGLAGLQYAFRIMGEISENPRYAEASILVVGADTPSIVPHVNQLSEVQKLGDGAGAAVVQSRHDVHQSNFIKQIPTYQFVPHKAINLPDELTGYTEFLETVNSLIHPEESELRVLQALRLACNVVAASSNVLIDTSRPPFRVIDWDQLDAHVVVLFDKIATEIVNKNLGTPANKIVETSKHFGHTLHASTLMGLALHQRLSITNSGSTGNGRILASSIGKGSAAAAILPTAIK